MGNKPTTYDTNSERNSEKMLSAKVSHCLIFGSSWTAWVFSVISLASYNWIAENVGSINGPYTYGLFTERATCSLCQPLQDPPPFLHATRAFMIMGCILGFVGCLLDVLGTLRFKDEPKLKQACAGLISIAAIFTMMGVAIFQNNGVTLLERNGVDGTLLLPYGYGLVLAWCTWVLYLIAIPFAMYEAFFRPPPPPPPPPSRESTSHRGAAASTTPL